MRTAIYLIVLLLIPAMGFAQIQHGQENQVEIADGNPIWTGPGSHHEDASGPDQGWLSSQGGDASDVVGGTDKSATKGQLAKGNAFWMDMDIVLEEVEFWLTFNNTQRLTFYVFQSPVEFGTYHEIYRGTQVITGSGNGWYASGPLSVPLHAENYYIIAVSWDGTLTYYYNIGESEDTDFGHQTHGFAGGVDPLPSTINSLNNDQAIYHQRLTYSAAFTTLGVVPDQISASTGGSSTFYLFAGSLFAGRNYILLGSVSGTAPGFPLPGDLTLPLNWDFFTTLVLKLANTPYLANFHGTLNASGFAKAKYNSYGPLPPLSVGMTMYFAFIVYKPYDFASNPILIQITS